MKILLGSMNQLKIESLKLALNEYFQGFEIVPVAVSSDVSDMPVGDDIKKGVDNRIKNLKKYAYEHNIQADYFIVLEDGIFECFDNWFMTNLAGIAADKSINYGMSGGLNIPLKYIKEVKEKTLGTVMNKLFETENTRCTNRAVGILTKNLINRTSESKEAYVLALTKFINSGW